MTTYVAFVPPTNSAFSFLATLDNASYRVVVTWNLFSSRWFVSLYDLSGTLILSLPRIESPDGYDLPISTGYFTDLLIYRESTSTFEIGGTLNRTGIVVYRPRLATFGSNAPLDVFDLDQNTLG